uniref:C3/C5 convertase n=1 Tax=Neogobius melanostomus TaxID=47308 RepID=A0A8C6WTN4_9GOBI
MLILWVILVSVQHVYSDPPLRNCSTTASIHGGHATYSKGGQEGSVLTYHCRSGQYPFPVGLRTCRPNGQWTTMRLSNGRPVTRATCKDLMCPAQLQLDNGHFWPRDQWFRVGSVQTFSCDGGFMLHGSAQRNCTISGEWTGTTPVCQDHADDCDDPGTPPGAQRQRFSGQFLVGDRVTYRCRSGLELLGSAQRECLQNQEWSGSAPRCPYMFDSPSAVAAAMAGSLAGVMDVLSPDSIKKHQASHQRTIEVSKGSRLNVFILLDTSGSISEEDFETSRAATISLIRKLETYEVQIMYHVLSFATKVIDIVDILNIHTSGQVDRHFINPFPLSLGHGEKTGTNLYAALSCVNEKIAILKMRETHFNETQNIIVIETDGYSNVGNRSSLGMKMIRSTLGYNYTAIDHTHERLLDVYVFGVGLKVKKDELNSLASKKRGEDHLFILKDYNHLGQVFNKIISDKTVTICGVAQEDEHEEGSSSYTLPWHVRLSGSKCSGSIVSPNWVLTAAHCFGRKGTDEVPQSVTIKHGEGSVMSKRVIMNSKYNVDALKLRNVTEFYDYDVALVELDTPIPLSWKARWTIIISTRRDLRLYVFIGKTLIPHTQTSVSFVHNHHTTQERKGTHIRTGNQRAACVEAARPTLSKGTDVSLEEYVPERLICSGGIVNKRDAITCKGDSGGSLFLEKGKRYFQVGVVSWGTHGCHLYSYERPPASARDFHIDVFKIISWLKTYLGKNIEFLQDVN